jgi:chromosome segregation ATPase
MEYAVFDVDDSRACSCLDRQQQSPASANETDTSDANGSETDSDEEVLKLQMKLSWAEGKHADLERQTQEAKSATAAVESRLREYEARNARQAIAVSEGEVLRAEAQKLKSAFEQKHTELEAAQRSATAAVQETDDARKQLVASLAENTQRGEEAELLKRQLSEANAHSQDTALSRALISNQQTKIDAQQTQIGELSGQNHQHIQDAQIHQQELENIHESLALAETSRDWYVRPPEIRGRPRGLSMCHRGRFMLRECSESIQSSPRPTRDFTLH